MRKEDALYLAEQYATQLATIARRTVAKNRARKLRVGAMPLVGVPTSSASMPDTAVAARGDSAALLVGFGTIPGRRPTDWKVAVRAWTRAGVDSPIVTALTREARQEVQVRVTGKIRGPRSVRNGGLRFRHKVQPLTPGYSVGHRQVTAGTLGAFAEDQRGRTVILSNNHVLANSNRGRIGDAILQPGKQDGGRHSADAVATLLHWKQLSRDASNRIDAAIATLDDGHDHAELRIPELGYVAGSWTGTPQTSKVAKVGRTTGLTRGEITALNLRSLPVDFGNVVYRFDGVLEVEGTGRTPLFSDGGDSGSLVLDGDNYAVGLLFAGDDVATFLNPIDEVLSEMNVSLLR